MGAPEAPPVTAPAGFDLAGRWRVHPQVTLRDESFGALAYHYGNRRLIFLRSRTLVALVESLERFESALAALDATVDRPERPSYERALARLAAAEVIDAR